MRFTYLFLVVIMVVGLFAGCQPAVEEAPEPEAPAEATMSDEDMLSAQTDAFAAAWGSGDAAAIAALFIEEGDTVGPDGVRFQGREALQGRYEELLGGMYQGTTVSISQTSVSFPSPEVAVVNGTYEIMGMKTAGGEDMTIKGLYMNVTVKQGGEWKIHCSRPMVPLPMPSTGT